MEEAVRVGARGGVSGHQQPRLPRAAAATVVVATLRQALVAHPGAFDEVVLLLSDDDRRTVQAQLDAGVTRRACRQSNASNLVAACACPACAGCPLSSISQASRCQRPGFADPPS